MHFILFQPKYPLLKWINNHPLLTLNSFNFYYFFQIQAEAPHLTPLVQLLGIVCQLTASSQLNLDLQLHSKFGILQLRNFVKIGLNS